MIQTHPTITEISLKGMTGEELAKKIASYADEPDKRPAGDPFAEEAYYCHRFTQYEQDFCKRANIDAWERRKKYPVYPSGAERGARYWANMAKGNYNKDPNGEEWKKNLGFATHFLADALCPPHCRPWSERSGAHLAFETKFSIIPTEYQDALKGSIIDKKISDGDIISWITEKAAKVYSMPQSYVQEGDEEKGWAVVQDKQTQEATNFCPYPSYSPCGPSGTYSYGIIARNASPYIFEEANLKLIFQWIGEGIRGLYIYVTQEETVVQPQVTTNLRIIELPPYKVGQTITAEFSIKNNGTAPITFNILTVGGRVNDICPNDKCPDFEWKKDITLKPNETYPYNGRLKLEAAGDYHFFTAYKTKDGQWNTAIPTAPDVNNTIDITVKSSTEKTDTEIQVRLKEPFTVWTRGWSGDKITQFSVTFEEVSFVERRDLGWPFIMDNFSKGRKGVKVNCKIKNLGPKQGEFEIVGKEIMVSEGYRHSTGSPAPSWWVSWSKLMPGEVSEGSFMFIIPEAQSPSEIIGSISGGLFAHDECAKFRLKLR
jgi:hypothetical protein